MSASVIRSVDNTIRRLDKPSEAGAQVTPEEVTDVDRMSRVLMRIIRDVSSLTRRWAPDVIEYEDFSVDGTGATIYRFSHHFGGRVRWYVVDWSEAASVACFVRHESSDENTLALVSYSEGIVTLRVEKAG